MLRLQPVTALDAWTGTVADKSTHTFAPTTLVWDKSAAWELGRSTVGLDTFAAEVSRQHMTLRVHGLADARERADPFAASVEVTATSSVMRVGIEHMNGRSVKFANDTVPGAAVTRGEAATLKNGATATVYHGDLIFVIGGSGTKAAPPRFPYRVVVDLAAPAPHSSDAAPAPEEAAVAGAAAGGGAATGAVGGVKRPRPASQQEPAEAERSTRTASASKPSSPAAVAADGSPATAAVPSRRSSRAATVAAGAASTAAAGAPEPARVPSEASPPAKRRRVSGGDGGADGGASAAADDVAVRQPSRGASVALQAAGSTAGAAMALVGPPVTGLLLSPPPCRVGVTSGSDARSLPLLTHLLLLPLLGIGRDYSSGGPGKAATTSASGGGPPAHLSLGVLAQALATAARHLQATAAAASRRAGPLASCVAPRVTADAGSGDTDLHVVVAMELNSVTAAAGGRSSARSSAGAAATVVGAATDVRQFMASALGGAASADGAFAVSGVQAAGSAPLGSASIRVNIRRPRGAKPLSGPPAAAPAVITLHVHFVDVAACSDVDAAGASSSAASSGAVCYPRASTADQWSACLRQALASAHTAPSAPLVATAQHSPAAWGERCIVTRSNFRFIATKGDALNAAVVANAGSIAASGSGAPVNVLAAANKAAGRTTALDGCVYPVVLRQPSSWLAASSAAASVDTAGTSRDGDSSGSACSEGHWWKLPSTTAAGKRSMAPDSSALDRAVGVSAALVPLETPCPLRDSEGWTSVLQTVAPKLPAASAAAGGTLSVRQSSMDDFGWDLDMDSSGGGSSSRSAADPVADMETMAWAHSTAAHTPSWLQSSPWSSTTSAPAPAAGASAARRRGPAGAGGASAEPLVANDGFVYPAACILPAEELFAAAMASGALRDMPAASASATSPALPPAHTTYLAQLSSCYMRTLQWFIARVQAWESAAHTAAARAAASERAAAGAASSAAAGLAAKDGVAHHAAVSVDTGNNEKAAAADANDEDDSGADDLAALAMKPVPLGSDRAVAGIADLAAGAKAATAGSKAEGAPAPGVAPVQQPEPGPSPARRALPATGVPVDLVTGRRIGGPAAAVAKQKVVLPGQGGSKRRKPAAPKADAAEVVDAEEGDPSVSTRERFAGHKAGAVVTVPAPKGAKFGSKARAKTLARKRVASSSESETASEDDGSDASDSDEEGGDYSFSATVPLPPAPRSPRPHRAAAGKRPPRAADDVSESDADADDDLRTGNEYDMADSFVVPDDEPLEFEDGAGDGDDYEDDGAAKHHASRKAGAVKARTGLAGVHDQAAKAPSVAVAPPPRHRGHALIIDDDDAEDHAAANSSSAAAPRAVGGAGTGDAAARDEPRARSALSGASGSRASAPVVPAAATKSASTSRSSSRRHSIASDVSDGSSGGGGAAAASSMFAAGASAAVPPSTARAAADALTWLPRVRPPAQPASFNLAALANYAKAPEKHPGHVLAYDNDWVVVADKYPKAQIHALVIARPGGVYPSLATAARVGDLKPANLRGLQALSAVARGVWERLKEEWLTAHPTFPGSALPSARIGFHAVPSLTPLHCHVLSSDMHSDWLKKKDHFLSFTSDAFFIDLDAGVIAPLAASGKLVVDAGAAEVALKGPLRCHHAGCKYVAPNMPALKRHLQQCANMAAVPAVM